MLSHWPRPRALVVVLQGSQTVPVAGLGEEVEGSGMHSRISGWKRWEAPGLGLGHQPLAGAVLTELSGRAVGSQPGSLSKARWSLGTAGRLLREAH